MTVACHAHVAKRHSIASIAVAALEPSPASTPCAAAGPQRVQRAPWPAPAPGRQPPPGRTPSCLDREETEGTVPCRCLEWKTICGTR